MSVASANLTRLRIAHVAPGLEMGGLEKLLVEFARRADRDRFDLMFVSLAGRGALAEAIEATGWPVLALDQPDGLRPGLVWRLARLFRNQGIDVVHTHDDKPLVYGAPAARLACCRSIHTQHHGKLAHIGRRQAFLVSVASRCVDRFVCVSQDSARAMIDQGVSPHKILTLWNGIDLNRFAFTGPEVSGPVVSVARLAPGKDLATLVKAVALLSTDLPNLRVEIAGEGPSRVDLETLTGQLGITDRVRILGTVQDVPALLARASLFVLPSLSEGISLTLLEAMARGLPVLTTRVGGNPEVVAEGETGILVPPGDPSALAQALKNLVSQPEKLRSLGEAGRQRVEAHFDIGRMIARYENLYRECAGRRANAGKKTSVINLGH